jgi:(E)-4-hydroxy-3-methylbut-2-enyl-diphosphate synthase
MNSFKYCPSLTTYKRLQTLRVDIGGIMMGSGHPIRIQSMTNTETSNTAATVNQIKQIADAGADYVRMTTRSVAEAKNLKNIQSELRSQGYSIPLVADVHFNPKIAETAASIVDKVRINPGNYAIKKTDKDNFDNSKQNFKRLIEICKKHNTAIRIGVNHGSLSQRIMDLYGNTPEGMVQSALEFIDVCKKQDFYQVVVSMKSSNTRVMVQANRLLVHHMLKNKMVFPLHLGVTEAGEGEDGRIKSAVGIGSLLTDGIGDTIRVSLTESPEKEIPVAKKIVAHITQKRNHENLPQIKKSPVNPFKYQKRSTKTTAIENNPVISHLDDKTNQEEFLKLKTIAPDFILKSVIYRKRLNKNDVPVVLRHEHWLKTQSDKTFPYFHSISQYLNTPTISPVLNFVFVSIDDMVQVESIKNHQSVTLILQSLSSNVAAEERRFIFEMIRKNIGLPIIIHNQYKENLVTDLQIKAACDLGPLFIDGLAEGIFIENRGKLSVKNILNTSFGILQASRMRISKTEFISCPSCGRTQFDIETTTQTVRKEMGHLKGLKIAVMGCIVNGPGEMADADYGYVGSGKGKVTLYKKKEVVKKNVPENKAIEELIKVIKENDDWVER